MMKEYNKQKYIDLLSARNEMIRGIAEIKKSYSHILLSGRLNSHPLSEFIKKLTDHLIKVEEEIIEYKMRFPESTLNNWESAYIDIIREDLEEERLFAVIAKKSRDAQYLDGGTWLDTDNGHSDNKLILDYITVHDPTATIDTVKEDYANEHGLMYGAFEVRELISVPESE
jgi:hypothetical protein